METESQPFDDTFKQKAQVLLNNIEQGDVGTAVRELLSMNDARNDSMFQQIGKIARGLHDALTTLDINSKSSGGDNEGKDVSTRIDYVINLTRDAANKTMDLADEATPIAGELGRESTKLRKEWGKLKKRELSAGEFRNLYQRIDDFLGFAEDKSNQLYGNLTDIVVTQGYQDLSGQVLQKIVDMLGNTERDLLSLLSITSAMHDVNGVSMPEPEPIEQQEASKKEEKDIVAEGPIPQSSSTLNSQDEVDDLLSSLGF